MWMTPAQVAEQLGIDTGKVLDWLHTKELAGVNVATKSTGRPRWRISAADLETFLQRRKSSPSQAPAPRSRRKAPDVIQFYR
jgi:excisionase family DNA binding protein